jgi:signal peptidase I
MIEQQAAAVVPRARHSWRLARRITFWLLFALAIALLIISTATVARTLRGFVDGSPTMENTIGPSDRLLVAVGSGFRRGDVVVLHVQATATGTDQTFVKRVIGLPGDHVACCDAKGQVTVNGKALDETYLYPGDRPSRLTFSVTVGKGKIFVMGDRRNISVDSRIWGPVSERGVVGRVVLLLHGSSFVALRTPQTFVADGLAPPDNRPELYVRLALLAVASAVMLLILAIGGVTSTILRWRRSRQGGSQFTPPAQSQPAPPGPPLPPDPPAPSAPAPQPG